MMATEGRWSASSCASRSTRVALTPVRCSTFSGVYVGETARPAVDERSRAAGGVGGTQLVSQDHVRQAERQHAVGARA